MDFYSEYSNKGLTGLGNLGNSCYVNSIIQLLSHTYELNNFMKHTNYKKNINECPESIIFYEWDKLRELMWSQNCTVAPHGFIQAVKKVSKIKKNNLFTGFDQNDALEFFIFLIDCFHKSIQRPVNMTIKGESQNSTDVLAIKCYEMTQKMFKTEYSEMINMFYGISVSQIKSIKTQELLSVTPEPFCTLSLSIPPDKKNINIFDCLDYYCQPEILEGDNAFLNEKTNKKEDVNKEFAFWSLPNVLIIDIKRYDIFGKKLMNKIDVPLDDVDFSKYICGYNKHNYIYNLYGVCNHSGGTLGGHYMSFIKNANNTWYMFNDTTIKQICPEYLISPSSYCFFFRKKINK